MLPPIDAHAHVDVRISPHELHRLGAAVLAVTRSIAEWDEASRRRDDEMALWGIGCHPAVPSAIRAFDVDDFAKALVSATFVGEVGLDRRSGVPMDRQVEVLTSVLKSVQQTPRAVSIHSTGTTTAVVELLEIHPIQTPILHWWRGTPRATARALELGCLFSLNGHEAASPKAISLLPLDRVLTETDFPHSRRYDEAATRPGATQTIERALMNQHRLDALDLRSHLWQNLAKAFERAGDVARPLARIHQLLRPSGPRT